MKNSIAPRFEPILLLLLVATADGANVQIGPAITQVTNSTNPIVGLGVGNVFGSVNDYGQLAVGDYHQFSSATLGLQVGWWNTMVGSCYGSGSFGWSNTMESDGTLIVGESNQIADSNLMWANSNIVVGSWNEMDSFYGSIVVGAGNRLELVLDQPQLGIGGAPSAIFGQGNTVTSGAGWVMGMFNEVSGDVSVALGFQLESDNAMMVSLGAFNEPVEGSRVYINEEDPVLLLGNGTYSARSNAIETYRNGQTVLINKSWKQAVALNSSSALGDPTPAQTDAGGNALVVEGHAVLKGKVVIAEAQGDVSMGIYD